VSDILEQLGERANAKGLAGYLEIQAYDEIKRLREENARLRRALEIAPMPAELTLAWGLRYADWWRDKRCAAIAKEPKP